MRNQPTNPNVLTFYAFNTVQALGRGIWMGNILSLYIVILAEAGQAQLLGLTPNELLGTTSAVTGVAMLLTSVPAGLLADRWSTRGVVLIAAILGVAGLLVLGLGTDLAAIVIGLSLWGMFLGASRPAAEAILANSTRSGDRSLIYSRAHLLEQIGMGSGPLLNVVLFWVLGDVWDLAILRRVMHVGLLVSCGSALIALAFRPQHTLGAESESLTHRDDPAADRTPDRYARLRPWIPYAFLASSFIIGSGAGMTVKFFPVFFRNVYGFQPVAVQLVIGSGLLLTAAATWLAQRVSRRRGRGELIVIVQALAIVCLVGMAAYPVAAIAVPLFLARGALMNAATPLSRTIVMDYVPRRRRAVWSSLQTIAWGLFWNVSAMVGGFLVGQDNFRRVFLVTAVVYVVGAGIIVPFVPAVHRETQQSAPTGQRR